MATNYKDRPMPVFRNLVNYTLFAPAIEPNGKQARLTCSFMDYRPRFQLFTNVSTDSENGRIGVGFYPDIFYGILDKFETVLDAEAGTVVPVRNMTDIRDENGRRTGERVVGSQLNFGKDENGLFYIQLLAQGRTKIKFFFKMSEYHQMFNDDKTPMTEEQGSRIVAKGWLNGIRKSCDLHCSSLAAEQVDRTSVKPAGATKSAPATSNANMFDLDDDIPM